MTGFSGLISLSNAVDDLFGQETIENRRYLSGEVNEALMEVDVGIGR